MLYFIKSGKFVKIGYAKNVQSRLSKYYTHNPDYQLLDVSEGTREMEKFLHKILKQYQFRTEWFHNVPEVYDVWNDFKQCYINLKKVPTKLNSFDIEILSVIGQHIQKKDNKYLINLNRDTIAKFRKDIKYEKRELLDFINYYIELGWIVPYKGNLKIFDINKLNEYLKDDPLTFDEDELRLYAYKIKYVDSN